MAKQLAAFQKLIEAIGLAGTADIRRIRVHVRVRVAVVIQALLIPQRFGPNAHRYEPSSAQQKRNATANH